MSNTAPVSGRKICVPRRRYGRDKPSTQTQLTTTAAAPSSFKFTPIAINADNEATLDKSDENKSDSFPAPVKTDPPASLPEQSVKSQDDETESKPDMFADAAAAASAFSQMSLHEKPARTLYEAIRLDDIDLLNELLADKTAVADQLNYALTMAVTKKSPMMAEILMKSGADPKYLDHCYPLLMTAADLNDSATVGLLLQYGVDPNAGGMHGTALHSAMRFGSVELVQKLMDAGAKLDHTGTDGLSLLALAVQANNMECVELILCKSSSQEVVDQKGRTPLHIAAQLGKIDIVQRLKEQGADPLLPDKEGNLPWMLAVKNKHKKEADLLFPGKNEINNAIGPKEKRPLHFACSTGMVRSAERLLREGANINAQDTDGLTPLMEAIRNKHQDVAIALVKSPKLKIDLTDKSGNTALFTTLHNFHAVPALPGVLKSANADLNKLLPHGRTIFMDLAQVPDVVKWLLDNGGDPTVRSDLGETALGNAVDWSSQESVRLLLSANIPLASLHEPGPRGNSPMEEAVSRSRSIMKLFVHAGCSVPFLSKWLLTESAATLCATYPARLAWLQRRAKNPATLQELSRSIILDRLGHSDVMRKVAALSLTPKINELLIMDTFSVWKAKSYNIDESEEEESEEEDDYYEDDTEDSEEYEDQEESDSN